jgi:HK97 family phage major capsid protein
MSTTEILTRLRASKDAAWEHARAIRERAMDEHRELSPSEQASWDAASAEIDAANARIDGILGLEARGKVADEFRSMAEPFLKPEDRGADGGEIRQMLRTGESVRDFDIPKSLQRQQRFAISDAANATSLYVSDFSNRVAMYLRTMSPWMDLATVVTTTEGRPLVVPTITADTTSYKPGEGTAITESTPTLGSGTATLTSYKTLSYVSAEAIDDVEYNLDDALAQSAARSIALAAGSDFTVAVLAGINNGGTATGTPFYNFNDLITVQYGRAAPYREAGRWVMANGAISKARKFVDSQGQYLWQPSGIAGQPDGLLGAAVREDPYLAAPASAAKSVAFGDWHSALVIKATNLRVEVSREFKFDTDQIAFKTVLRAGIVVQDPAAAAFLVSGNS